MDHSSAIRPLGPCETFSSSRHELGFYKCVANTCRYSVPRARLRGQAISHVLETAVANVVLALPSLSVGIVGEATSKPYFVQLATVNLQDHVQCVEKPDGDPDSYDSSLLSILQGQHDRPWPDIEHRPPWKLIAIVRSPESEDGVLLLDVVFAVHHAIADGRSSALFHTKLLNELNRPGVSPSQLSDHILTMEGVGKLGPPLEEVVEFSTSWSFLLQTLWRELGPAWLRGHQLETPWAGMVITREPCQTRLRLVTVSADKVPRILAACRANQTTLTPLLHALALASLAKHLRPEDAQAFRSTTPIDLRPFIQDSSQANGGRGAFGVFVTAQSHFFNASTVTAMRERPGEDEIWRAAAELRRSMKQHLESVPKDDIMGMLGWVSDWPGFWLAKVGKPRQDTWEVSNIGSMPGGNEDRNEADEGWRIQRSIMSQGATVAGAAINISVAGVAGGDIGIALSWQEGIIPTETADGLAGDLQDWLDTMGQGKGVDGGP